MKKTLYTKNRNDMKTIELKLPQWLMDHGVNKIASEYGSLCVNYRDKSLRTTFNSNNIDTTLYSFHNKSISIKMSRDLANLVREFISNNWLTLIGKDQSGESIAG